ncbi:phosphodiester glycosidase family protein [Wukongibacter baidiensis]|uniref:phosphodiester glycosidase family protein n=1 Tax=Wukongibacter baidiensis TaxID=1723361 RepID=UPI003D7F3034
MNLKKSLIKLLTTALIFNTVITFSFADFVEIHEERSSENISRGVVYEKISRFTNRGWLNMNILRIDLDDKYTSLDVITSETGMSGRDALTGLASKNKSASRIIGAVNGDFYDTKEFSTIGPIVRDGDLVTSSKNSPDFATFNIDNDGKAFIDYWAGNTQKLMNLDNDYILDINHKNKSYVNNGVILLDKSWGKLSFGKEKHENIVELIIIKDKIKEIRDNLEAIEIPEDGYIIAAAGTTKEHILNNFSVGDRVLVDVSSTPDFKELALAMGGGAEILKDGSIPDEFSLNISGSHPRTAIGISQDKKEVIMVTIDGRNASYPGVTQKELAEILLELGAYNGINLDGGGSTEMIVKSSGDMELDIVNHPSGGYERRIMNGLAVLNNGPESSLKGIKLDTSDNNIFIDTSRELFIKGYDKNYNPVEIDPTEAEWSIEGIEGRFVENKFIPQSVGKGTITASYRGKTASIEVKALDNPIELKISPSKIYVESGKQVPISVIATNDEGYEARIDSSALIWSIPDNMGKIKDNTFISTDKVSNDLIKASFYDLNAYIHVSTGLLSTVLEDFESLNGSFLPYPNEVAGDLELSSKEKSGDSSVKLSYDFSNANDTKAAYIVFDNDGIPMEERPEKLGMWVYGNKGNSHWLRGKLTDSNGNSFSLTFERYVDWEGWKFVEASVPSGAVAPLKLERLYLVEIEPGYKDSGYIYIDDLTAFYKSKINKEIPKDTVVYSDTRNVSVDLKNENSFRFLAHGGISDMDTLLDNLVVNKLSNVSNDVDLSLFTNQLDDKLKEKLSKDYMVVASGYSHTKFKNSSFIKLNNNNNGSIRATDYNQWTWLLNTLKTIDSDSLFVTLPKPLSFKDKLEEKLFLDTLKNLKEDKNIDVWIFTGGNDKNFEVEATDGIRIVKLKTYPTHNKFDYKQLKYMIFTVNDGHVTYEIKDMYEK